VGCFQLACGLGAAGPSTHAAQSPRISAAWVVTASQMIQREWDKRLDFSSAAIDGDGNGDDGGEVKIKGDHDFMTFGRWSTVLMSYVLVEIHEESAVD
jgi:hypothetical protein